MTERYQNARITAETQSAGSRTVHTYIQIYIYIYTHTHTYTYIP